MKGRSIGLVAVLLVFGGAGYRLAARPTTSGPSGPTTTAIAVPEVVRTETVGRRSPFLAGVRYRPHALPIDQGGFKAAVFAVEPWKPEASLREIAEHWGRPGYKGRRDGREAVGRSRADPHGWFSLALPQGDPAGLRGRAGEAYAVRKSCGRSSRATRCWPSRPWAR